MFDQRYSRLGRFMSHSEISTANTSDASAALSLLGQLYDAATDVTKWPEFLKAFVAYCGCFAGHLLFFDHRNRLITFSIMSGLPNADPTLVELYSKDPRGPDHVNEPWHPGIVRKWHPDADENWYADFNPKSYVYADRMFCSTEHLHKSEIYRRLLEPHDAEYMAAIRFEDADQKSALAVFRGRRDAPFSPADLERMKPFAPHVKRAMALHRQLSQLDLERTSALDVLNGIRLGIAIADQAGKLLFVNKAGLQIGSQKDGLECASESFVVAETSARRELFQAINAVVDEALNRRTSRGRAINVSRQSGKQPYSLLVTALWGNLVRAQHDKFAEPVAVVFMSDPDSCHGTPASLLQHLFDLTGTEALVLSLMLEGCTVEDMTKRLNVSENTVRTHVKNLLRKTNTTRQTDLLRAVMSSPMWIFAPNFAQ